MAGHITSVVRKQQEMEAGAELIFLFIQSKSPAQGRVPPTFKVGLPPHLTQSRKSLEEAC